MSNPNNDFFNAPTGASGRSGACATIEPQLFLYLDHQLPAAQVSILEAHLAVCAHCRVLCRHWQQLDAQLARGLPNPVLSSDFMQRLSHRLEQQSTGSNRLSLADTQQHLETNLGDRWKVFRKNFLWSWAPQLLDWLGYILAIGCVAYYSIPLSQFILRPLSSGGANGFRLILLTLALAPSVLSLLFGLSVAIKRPMAKWF